MSNVTVLTVLNIVIWILDKNYYSLPKSENSSGGIIYTKRSHKIAYSRNKPNLNIHTEHFVIRWKILQPVLPKSEPKFEILIQI